MADSMLAEGIVNPIEIDKNYMIVTGETRWRSAKFAGIKLMPCRIIEIKDEKDRFSRQMIENLHHGTMTAWEVANGFQKMIDDNKDLIHSESEQIKTEKNPKGSGQKATEVKWLNLRTGTPKSSITNFLSLLGEDETVTEALAKDEIKWTSIDEAKKAPKEYQKELKERLVKGELKSAGAHGMRALARALKNRPEEAKNFLKQNYSNKNASEVRDIIQETVPDYTETPLSDALVDASKSHIEIMSAVAKLSRALADNPKENILNSKLSKVFSSLLIMDDLINKYLGEDKGEIIKLDSD